MSTEQKSGTLVKLLVLFGLLFIVFGFGINLVYLLAPVFKFKFDRGQFWTVAVLASIFLYLIILLITRKWKLSLGIYAIINITVVGTDLVLFFLFKNPYLKSLIYTAFGIKW